MRGAADGGGMPGGKNGQRNQRRIGVLAAVLWVLVCWMGLRPVGTWAAEAPSDGLFDAVEAGLSGQQVEDLQEIDRFLSQDTALAGTEVSFSELVKLLMQGEGGKAGEMIVDGVRQSLFQELEQGIHVTGQLLMLGIIGAVFANFSGIFSGGQMAETGFFLTYLMAFALMAGTFFESVEVAGGVLGQQVLFMRVLMPAYAAAVAWAGAAGASVAWYELVLFLISGVQWLYMTLLLPGIRVYLMLVLAGNLVRQDMLSKMTDLLKSGIQWGMRSLLGVVLGFQLIQGMVLPYADAVKTGGVQKLLQVIPGVGTGAAAVARLMLGSGVLIKNTVGAAAVVILLLLSLVPLLKLAVLLFLYRGAAAVLEPVADKRLVACISGVADGQKMLLGLAFSGLFLFVLTIALICLGTNTANLI